MARNRTTSRFGLPTLRLDLFGHSRRRTRRSPGDSDAPTLRAARKDRPAPSTRSARTTRTARSADAPRRQRRTQAAERVVSRERGVPPVMVRGGMPDMSWQTGRRTSRPKRRYDFTLNVPGAEMRLPAIPQVTIGWRLFSFAIAASLLALLYTLWTSPRFQVEGAEISGLQRISSRDVNTVMDVRGEPVFALDARQLRARLQEAFPEFAAVQVDIALPARVSVVVEERQPVLTWKQEGRTLLVDAQGVAFPLRSLDDSYPTLVVEAMGLPAVEAADLHQIQSSQFMPVEMISSLVSLSAQAPQGTPLVYDPLRGFGWMDPAGWQVYVGDVTEMEMKLRLYGAMVKMLQQAGEQPALVSVEFVHNPYYRLNR